MFWLKSLARPVAVLALASAAALQAHAADIASCRSISDDRARLDCYDRIQLDRPVTAAPGAVSPMPGRAPSAPAPVATAEPAAPAAPPAAKDDDFGRSSLSFRILPESHPEPDSITSKLTSIGSYEGKPLFRLANGQSWAAQDYAHPLLKHDGSDSVTIEKSYFGYLLRINDASGQIS